MQRLESIDVEYPAEDIEPYLLGGHRASVHIQELRKVYGGGKVAVDGLTLDLFEDHITALLGHNGAGKSTTISMLTGLIRPSSGDVHIWGQSICKDMNDIRRWTPLYLSFFSVHRFWGLSWSSKGCVKHYSLIIWCIRSLEILEKLVNFTFKNDAE